jgi:hypothetical protein
MPVTLAKLKESKIKIASKLLKKDEDFLPISPELIKDLRDKTLLENSALKLSISDYQLMCRSNTVLNMMAIALNKPKTKLKQFCKHMPVFEENISKSSKSIANKINGPITNLPKEIRSTILDKFAEILPSKYVLLDWIDKDKLDWDCLSENSNAIDLLKENQDEINWKYLCLNPNAIELLKKNQDRIKWEYLSANPNAIDLLKENISRSDIYWKYISSNPNAIDLIKERIEYENSLTKKEYNDLYLEDKINWNNLSGNPNAIDLLKENKDKINWLDLSTNPNAIDLLKENKDNIIWFALSRNPNAIDLLEERIKYEKSLTDAQLDQLKNKINWNNLSKNPNAIDLLKKNQDKINWDYLSQNPNAINLLKDRIEYEKSLTDAQFNRLEDKINWNNLSANPNAIDLLKKQINIDPDKLDWLKLSKNPNAIDLLKKNQDKIRWAWFSLNPAIFKAV